MRCTKCERELEDDMKYCPSCGREVGHKIKCDVCGKEIQDTDRYCPYCGDAKRHAKTPNDDYVQEPKDNVNNDGIYFDNSQSYQHWENPEIPREKTHYSKSKDRTKKSIHDDPKLDHEAIKNDQYRGYWKKPIIWIISLCMIAAVTLSIQYIQNISTSNNREEVRTKKVVGNDALKFGESTNDSYVQQTNQMLGGITYIFENNFYYVLNGEIMVIENIDKKAIDFKEGKVVLKGSDVTGDLYVNSDYVYYSDNSDDYYRYNFESKESEMILDNAFYLNVIDDNIYYQNDTDNESIHVYDLNTGDDKAINSEKSYCLLIDTEKSLIYYYTTNEDKAALKAISLDGAVAYTLVDNINRSVSITKHENNIYYCRDRHLYSLDVSEISDNMTDTKISDDYVYMVNSFNDGLLYMDSNREIKWCGYDGNNVKEFDFFKSGDVIYNLSIEKDKVFAIGLNGIDTVIYVFDLEDNFRYLKSSDGVFDYQDEEDNDDTVDIEGSVDI